MSKQEQGHLVSLARKLKDRVRNAMSFLNTSYEWSIGIYTGDSPFTLGPEKSVRNPVLTAADVTDMKAEFIADPFLIKDGNTWHMFSEVLDADTGKGVIAHATSVDGFHWRHNRIVLIEDCHLSYPYVFKWLDRYYMIPETFEKNAVRLYRATEFPTTWSFEKTLIEGDEYVDSSLFFYGDIWWMFVGTTANDMLYLFFADTPLGPWHPHPASPLIQDDTRIARPGGRVLVYDNKIIRFTQDCELRYGHRLHAFEVTELTKDRYKERRINDKPFMEPSGHGWNAHGMHQIDIQQLDDGHWIACVDGCRRIYALS
jgi:hypothetical protein